jgi:hypothetical protein
MTVTPCLCSPDQLLLCHMIPRHSERLKRHNHAITLPLTALRPPCTRHNGPREFFLSSQRPSGGHGVEELGKDNQVVLLKYYPAGRQSDLRMFCLRAAPTTRHPGSVASLTRLPHVPRCGVREDVHQRRLE